VSCLFPGTLAWNRLEALLTVQLSRDPKVAAEVGHSGICHYWYASLPGIAKISELFMK
jgi:hypothetical protein